MSAFSLPVGGVDLAVYRGASDTGATGSGIGLLCLHETGATAASWAPFAAAGDVIRYDRRGWGASTAPEPYLRTTVGEQAQDALALLDGLDIERAALVGAGLGAVAALDLALREPDRVQTVVAIEPPLLALADGATEGLSNDVASLREAAEEAGPGAGGQVAADLFLEGRLPFLAPGAERLPVREKPGGGDGIEARRRPASLIAELGAVAAWPLPFEALAASEVPLAIAVGSATPDPLRRAASTLVTYAPAARLVEVAAADPMTAPGALVEAAVA